MLGYWKNPEKTAECFRGEGCSVGDMARRDADGFITLVDRKSNLADAMLTSLSACAANPGPLLLWAACIVFLTLLGFATLLFGLVVIMPILGHASWHAYRDLVE